MTVEIGSDRHKARSHLSRFALIVYAILIVIGFIVAIWPEPPATILTSSAGWTTTAAVGAVVPSQYSPEDQQARRSVLQSSQSVMLRTYTPENGVQPAEIVSPPFRAGRLLSVLFAGDTAQPDGATDAFLDCSTQPHRLPIAFGDVITNETDALVSIPDGWCAGAVRAHAISTGADLVGIGTVASVAEISAWKQSFVGLLPYLTVSLAMFALVGLAGAALLRAMWRVDAVPGALLSLGLVFYGAFWAFACQVPIVRLAYVPLVALASLATIVRLTPDARRSLVDELKPAAAAWLLVALSVFCLLSVATSGVMGWAPNHRFYPAIWSSDDQLPWLVAEGLRNNWDMQTVVAPWSVTDRPPLMAGGHLLVSDLFAALMRQNDGDYLRGMAYATSAIALSALWAPALYYLTTKTLRTPRVTSALIVLVASLTPFFLFNTTYGWPKLLGGAFGAIAVAFAFQAQRDQSVVKATTLFGAAAALSLLCHFSNAMFILPLGVWLLVRRLYKAPVALVAGAATGAVLLAPWQFYQQLIPSTGALTRLALTGALGFSASPSLGAAVLAHYESLGLMGTLALKLKLLVTAFIPIKTGMNDLSPTQWFAGGGALGYLRQWDFLYLTIGNLPLLLGAAVVFFRAPANAEGRETHHAARAMILLALASYLFTVAVFSTPLVVIELSYALILMLAGATLAAASLRPLLLRALAWAAASYMAIVWDLGTLPSALHIDVVAIVGLALTLLLAVGWWPRASPAQPAGA
jgi:hypothetical protein